MSMPWEDFAPQQQAPAQAPSSSGGGNPWDDFAPPKQENRPEIGLGVAYDAASSMAPWNILRQKTLDPAGEKVAEAGGRMGYPATGAAIGTAIQMSPEIL